MMGVSLSDVYPEAELATFMPFVLSSHMDNSPLTVLELDADLRIVRVSSSVTQMLGLNPQRLAGQPLLQALGPGKRLSSGDFGSQVDLSLPLIARLASKSPEVNALQIWQLGAHGTRRGLRQSRGFGRSGFRACAGWAHQNARLQSR